MKTEDEVRARYYELKKVAESIDANAAVYERIMAQCVALRWVLGKEGGKEI
jgi:hypothetical protein